MKWFLGTYTSRFNRRHKLFGHLFSGRYKSLIVDASNRGYLKTVSDYVHLKPIRACLLKPGAGLTSHRWSSYPEYLKPPAKRPPWLRIDRLRCWDPIRPVRDSWQGAPASAEAAPEQPLADDGRQRGGTAGVEGHGPGGHGAPEHGTQHAVGRGEVDPAGERAHADERESHLHHR